jgi:hypothetical protein
MNELMHRATVGAVAKRFAKALNQDDARRRSRRAACWAGMVALAAMACSDPTRPSDGESRHELRLQWTGATQGAFAVDAEAPRTPIDYLAPVVCA